MGSSYISETHLGQDPNRVHRINANSFQQDAITTFNGWQYAVLYVANNSKTIESSLYVAVARRCLADLQGAWQHIVLDDYEQTTDDGHNTISIGISRGDGSIHLSFDHHCNALKYRRSTPGVALSPQDHLWDATIFSPVMDRLPGTPDDIPTVTEVSYPRFVNMEDDLLFSYRIGQAGSGSEVVWTYSSQQSAFSYLGKLLVGLGESPYPNGWDYRDGKIHVSWCYRGFVEYEGVYDASSTRHKAQAGPNGPENNYNLCYMYSDDRGAKWYTSSGRNIVDSEHQLSSLVTADTEGIAVFEIPKYSGILNQEGQCVDPEGGFHVLNRENTTGEERWYVYSRDKQGTWKKVMFPHEEPTETGSRGSICSDRASNIYIVLPGNRDASLQVLRLNRSSYDWAFESIWRGDGYDGEPLVDTARLQAEDLISIFTRTATDSFGSRHVVVIDLDLSCLSTSLQS